MSTDEKPTIEEAPAQQPRVRVLEINLADLLGARMPRMTGIELQAAALATITIFKEASESAPKHLEQMLLGAWDSVFQRLNGRPSPGCEIQAQVLQEYFQHAGDWSAMRRCIISRGEKQQAEPGDFHRRYESHLETARKEYAAQFGSAA